MRNATWFKRFMIVILLSVFAVGVIACGRDDDEDDDDPIIEPERTTIESVLTEAEVGEEVRIGGTVYGERENGVYVSDSDHGKLFIDLSGFTPDFTLDVGQEIELVGTFTRSGNQPIIEAVSELTLEDEDGTMPTPTAVDAGELLGFDPSQTTGAWYRYVEITGHIHVDSTTLQVQLVDDFDDAITFSNDSAIDTIEAYENQRVTITAIVGEYSAIAGEWRLLFTDANTLEASPYTADDVEAMLEVYFEETIPTSTTSALSLPATFSRVEDVTITWATDLEPLVILPLEEGADSYETTINIPDEDTTGTLTATITYGEETFEMTVGLTLRELVQMSLEDALDSGDETVKFDAVVVGFAETQTASMRSIILQDLNNPNVFITADYPETTNGYGQLTEVDPEIGDVLIIAGTHRQTGRPSIVDVFETIDTTTTQAPVYDKDNAYHLDSEESWEAFPGHNTFVKISNPFMRYSTSSSPSPTNWIRLGYDVESVGTNYGSDNDKSYAFLIRAFDNMMGETWRDTFDITRVGEDPVLFEGDIYAFIIYETNTYLQMVIVDQDHVELGDYLEVRFDLVSALPQSVDEDAGDTTITLPDAHDLVDTAITWESSDPDIISAADGTIDYSSVPGNITVTLTATYTIDETPYTHDIDVVVFAEKVVYQVDDVLATKEDGEAFFTEGVVLTAGYNTAGGLSDVFVQDKTTGNIMIVQGLGSYYGDTIQDGDLIELFASMDVLATDNEPGKQVVRYESRLDVLEQDFGIVDYRQNAIEIASHEDYMAMLDEDTRQHGQVYHITGGYFINGTTSSLSYSNLRFHLNPDASGIGSIRVGGKTNVLNLSGNEPNLGENWDDAILGINPDNYPGLDYPGFEYPNAGFYVILKNTSPSYNYWSIVSADDFYFETDYEQVGRELDEQVPSSTSEGDLTLPSEHELADDAIAWTSSHPDVIDADTGAVTYSDVSVDVTLTASYMVDGEPYEATIHVTVIGVALNVTEVLNDREDGDTVRVKGIVVGFHWNGSSNRSPLTNGVLIKEASGNELLYVVGLYETFGDSLFEYDVDGHMLDLGDEIEFTATYSIATETGFAGRPTLTIESETAAELTIHNTAVAYDFNLEEAQVISNGADLADFAENLSYNQLFKVEGPFTLNSSTSTYGDGINMRLAYGEIDSWGDLNLDVTWSDRGQRPSFKFDANIPHLGNDWWIDALNITEANMNEPDMRNHLYTDTTEIYFYVGSALPTAVSSFGYIQLVILDADWIDATREADVD